LVESETDKSLHRIRSKVAGIQMGRGFDLEAEVFTAEIEKASKSTRMGSQG
jgi:hypothetical protein